MRVILIMIADRVNVMRQIKDTGNEEDRVKVANEAAYLYAPLAHKLGLYKLKSELEDLSLKYTQRETYYYIKEKLNETKASRDKYIASFIDPIQKKVKEAGLKFDIKGRTKSIHSIWNKIQKQKTPFEGIYDLFAIRIILDSNRTRLKRSRNAGRYTLSLQICISPIQNVCGTGFQFRKQRLRIVAYHCDGAGRQMGGSTDSYPANGWRSQNGDSPHTGDTKASKVKQDWTNG